MREEIREIVAAHGNDRTRLMDILWGVQRRHGYVPSRAVHDLGEELGIGADDVRETLSFYHFFRDKPFGKHAIYLSDTVIARMNGFDSVLQALQHETGARIGEVSADGMFGLGLTACIGLSDQEPAMLVDDVVFTRLTPEKVTDIIRAIRGGKTPEELANPQGHPRHTLDYVESMVDANIQNEGPVFFRPDRDYEGLLATALKDNVPEDLITILTDSGLRGRGGAGFPTGLKWRLGREAPGEEKYIVCNADEGEPGTFKDRVLLMRSPKDVFLGMIFAGYAVGASNGIVYLRSEYWYLKEYLEHQLQEMRQSGLLGSDILGSGFDFDIRIQMGAGAYICGDETALIESLEGKRGTPRVKPPYPIQQGYLGKPTIVNNVETLAAISRIIPKGAHWYQGLGTSDTPGTRLLSVSGDCEAPGIYEVEWGIPLKKVLRMVGAQDPMAVQVSGPSGECVSALKDAERIFCHNDLSCNGSLMIFNRKRDLLKIVEHFMEFFVEESCGICTPCRAGGVQMLGMIRRINAGKATQDDLQNCRQWGALMTATSRCGLGTTAAKPILTTLKAFPELYEARLARTEDALLPCFDPEKVLHVHDRVHQELEEEARR